MKQFKRVSVCNWNIIATSCGQESSFCISIGQELCIIIVNFSVPYDMFMSFLENILHDVLLATTLFYRKR